MTAVKSQPQTKAQLHEENQMLREQLRLVQDQLDWLKRQMFGSKSEKRLDVDTSQQQDLLAKLGLEPVEPPPPPTEKITYERRKKQRDSDTVSDTGLRFDETVPVQVIEVDDPQLKDIPQEELELVSEKVNYRLAQQPSSYVVLKYIRKVYKRLDTQELTSPVMPTNVLERSVADVSLLAGLLIDKFLYHLPLYRQHQRLTQSGITLSRTTLANWVTRSIELLSPIVDAQAANILLSRILAMDETPIKAGVKKKGKMRQAYLWPVYGELDEIVFHYAANRKHEHVEQFIGSSYQGTLLTDGYAAYERYADKMQGVIQALCWAHTRRKFEQALTTQAQAANEALMIIGELYRHETHIRDKALSGEEKQAYRTKHSEPVVKAFWQWCEQQCQRSDLLPKEALSKALKYAMSRQRGLEVFLSDPDVSIDTNHVERALRNIPMGRRNWLFCWTELGAKHVGIIQSLLVTCKLQGVDPYVYLIDVLQRIGQHPASQVDELTPRVWKEKFADKPLQSDLLSRFNTV